MNLNNLRTYFGIVFRLYPLLLIFYIFYIVAIDFAYSHVDLIVIKIDGPITDEECVRDRVDYRLTQILIFFTLSASLLVLSKLPTKLINKLFLTKRLTALNINFVSTLNFYSSFYLIFGFTLLILLAFIYGNIYSRFVTPFHSLMLFLIPILIIYRANKNANN